MRLDFQTAICRPIAGISFVVSEHVHQLLLRMHVRRAKGSPEYRSQLVKPVGGIESRRSDVLGTSDGDDRLRRLPVCRDWLLDRQIHQFRYETVYMHLRKNELFVSWWRC